MEAALILAVVAVIQGAIETAFYALSLLASLFPPLARLICRGLAAIRTRPVSQMKGT